MLQESSAFSGFSVSNLEAAKEFYQSVLGLIVYEESMGLSLKLDGVEVFIYEKPDHKPAEFTILNFRVADINASIDNLESKGVVFERYDNLPAPQDEKGVLRGLAANMGPDIAWFKDPSENVFAILQES